MTSVGDRGIGDCAPPSWNGHISWAWLGWAGTGVEARATANDVGVGDYVDGTGK